MPEAKFTMSVMREEKKTQVQANNKHGFDEERGAKTWKEVLDEKLHRLHSLQFGADLALEQGDAETALALGLCLLGFLETERQSDEDQCVFISPIIEHARQTVDAAREKAATPLDRRSFEQANCEIAKVFKKSAAMDLDKIKQSKYFAPFFGSRAESETRLVQATPSPWTENFTARNKVHGTSMPANKVSKVNTPKLETRKEGSSKGSRNLTQAKLTALYGNGGARSSDASIRLPVNAVTDFAIHEERAKSRLSQAGYSRSQTNSQMYVDCQEEKGQACPLKLRKCFHPEDVYADREEEKGCSVTKRRKASDLEEPNCVHKRAESKSDSEGNEEDARKAGFVTAKQKWAMDSLEKRNCPPSFSQPSSSACTAPSATSYHTGRNAGPKTLGMSRRGVRGQFIPPMRPGGGSGGGSGGYATTPRNPSGCESGMEDSTRRCMELLLGPDGELPDKLKNVEPRLIEHISNEIMDQDPNVRWDDIAGLEHAKKCVTEMVIWPLLRPDIFQGCRSPGKGLLLFGPPGTGKTMIGKAIAGEAKATFFSISASSLTSKWIGEGEKLVRALFGVASCRQPAVIFVDEIDSLLSQRKSDGEHESSRRLKTQFLIEMEGCGSGNDQLLLIGATNRPQELDEAARRRLSKRLYIPLPSSEARAWIIQNLLKKDGLFSLSESDIRRICAGTEGYSGSDMSNLVKEASMGPLREALMQGMDINKIKKEEMRPVILQDFENALQHVKPSVSQSELGAYEDWNRQFGSHSI